MQRRLFLILLIPFVLLLAACSKSPTDPGANLNTEEYVFRTPQYDNANGATVLPSGDFLVYGFAEGRIGYGDWTNAFPLLLFMHADGSVADTVIYRNIKYGEIRGAAPFGNEVAVLVDSVLRVSGSEPNLLRIHLLQADHSLGDIIYSLADSTRYLSTPANPLVPTPDNGLIFAFWPSQVAEDNIIKIGANGEIAWTYHMPGLWAIDTTEDGYILVIGASGNVLNIVSLGIDGEVQWQTTYREPGVSATRFAAVQNGAAVLGTQFVATGAQTIVLTRIDKNGDLLWQRTYGEGRILHEGALTTLADGSLLIGWSKDATLASEPGGYRAEVVRLKPDGEVAWRHPFGPAEGTTVISQILTLANNRFAVVGATGPERIDGNGADDFDVLVMLLDDK